MNGIAAQLIRWWKNIHQWLDTGDTIWNWLAGSSTRVEEEDSRLFWKHKLWHLLLRDWLDTVPNPCKLIWSVVGLLSTRPVRCAVIFYRTSSGLEFSPVLTWNLFHLLQEAISSVSSPPFTRWVFCCCLSDFVVSSGTHRVCCYHLRTSVKSYFLLRRSLLSPLGICQKLLSPLSPIQYGVIIFWHLSNVVVSSKSHVVCCYHLCTSVRSCLLWHQLIMLLPPQKLFLLWDSTPFLETFGKAMHHSPCVLVE